MNQPAATSGLEQVWALRKRLDDNEGAITKDEAAKAIRAYLLEGRSGWLIGGRDHPTISTAWDAECLSMITNESLISLKDAVKIANELIPSMLDGVTKAHPYQVDYHPNQVKFLTDVIHHSAYLDCSLSQVDGGQQFIEGINRFTAKLAELMGDIRVSDGTAATMLEEIRNIRKAFAYAESHSSSKPYVLGEMRACPTFLLSSLMEGPDGFSDVAHQKQAHQIKGVLVRGVNKGHWTREEAENIARELRKCRSAPDLLFSAKALIPDDCWDTSP